MDIAHHGWTVCLWKKERCGTTHCQTIGGCNGISRYHTKSWMSTVCVWHVSTRVIRKLELACSLMCKCHLFQLHQNINNTWFGFMEIGQKEVAMVTSFNLFVAARQYILTLVQGFRFLVQEYFHSWRDWDWTAYLSICRHFSNPCSENLSHLSLSNLLIK